MPDQPTFTLQQGTSPLLISIPHVGTHIPAALRDRLQPRAQDVEDTDWHLNRLYDFAPELGASVLMARYSRYVIDLNRPPDDQPMYPGAANTELCPTRFFTGEALYLPGQEPGPDERLERRQRYWHPYHGALAAELARLRAIHGFVLLWDAHSIRSRLPWLFEGRLPDLNIGTAAGASADARIAEAVVGACRDEPGLSHVLNGRFKGGYITRHYGDPAQHLHAVQLEKCQCLYMQEEAPFAYEPALADRLKPVLLRMVRAALETTIAIHGH
jgi:N-formylglutamate deformylase